MNNGLYTSFNPESYRAMDIFSLKKNSENIFEVIKEKRTFEEEYDLLLKVLCYLNYLYIKPKEKLRYLCGENSVKKYTNENICSAFFKKHNTELQFFEGLLDKAEKTDEMMVKWVILVFLYYVKAVRTDWDLKLDSKNLEEDIKKYIIVNKELPYLFIDNENLSKILLAVIKEFSDLKNVEENKIRLLYRVYFYSCKYNSSLYKDSKMYNLFNDLDVCIDEKVLEYFNNIARQIKDSSKLMNIVRKSFENKEYIMCEKYIIYLNKHSSVLTVENKEELKDIFNKISVEKRKYIIYTDIKSVSSNKYLESFVEYIKNYKFDNFENLIKYLVELISCSLKIPETSIFSLVLRQFTLLQNRKTNLNRSGSNDFCLDKLLTIMYNENISKNNFYLDLFEEYKKEVNNEFIMYFEYMVYSIKNFLFISCNPKIDIDNFGFRFENLSLNFLYIVEPMIRTFLSIVENKNLKITESELDEVELLGQTFPRLKKFTILDKEIWEYLKDRILGVNDEMVKKGKYIRIEGFRNHYMHGLSFNTGSPYLAIILILVLILFYDLNESLTQFKELKSNEKKLETDNN